MVFEVLMISGASEKWGHSSCRESYLEGLIKEGRIYIVAYYIHIYSFILVFNLSTYTLHTLYKKATLSFSLIYSKGYDKLLSACRFIVGKTFYRRTKVL